MKCSCGFTNASGARFCGSCGLPLSAPAAPAPAEVPVAAAPPVLRRPARKWFSVGRAAGLLLVALAAAGGYWWMNRPAGPYEPDNGGLYPIKVEGKYGFMDKTGKTVITPQFEELAGLPPGFSEGFAAVRIGNKVGYIDAKGVLVITPQFDDAMPFRYGRAAVKLCCGAFFSGGGKFGFIDTKGKYIHTPDFPWVRHLSSDKLTPVRTSAGALAFLSPSGDLTLVGRFTSLETGFSEGKAAAAVGGKWGYIDSGGSWVIDPQFEHAGIFSEGLAAVTVGGRMGYIDAKGKFAINPQFQFGLIFYRGFASVQVDGKYGAIDPSGRMVIEPKYSSPVIFRDGLAPVNTGDGWGFIDPSGKLVIPPDFDAAEGFQNGLARVTVLEKEAYITTAGAFVVDPFPGTTPREEKARRLAEAEKAALQAKTDARARVEQGILGEWTGEFGNNRNVQLSITADAGLVAAVLLNNGWREVFRAEVLEDNRLRLTGTEVTRIGPPIRGEGEYSLDTVEFVLSVDGAELAGPYRDGAGRTGAARLTKVSR